MLKEYPLVSLIIPCFNHERFVALAIKSVINQTYPNIEFIVLNDGSSDSTHDEILKLAKECKSRFTNFIYINKQNEGLSKTLNKGIRLSKGEYISLLASDDLFLPDKITLQVETLSRTKADVGAVYSDGYIIDNTGERLATFTDKYPVPLFKNIYKNLLVENWVCAVSLLYKRNVLFECGLFTENIKVEDHDMLLKISSKYKIIFMKEKLVEYRWHGNNFSNDSTTMLHQLNLTSEHHPDLKSFLEFGRAVKRGQLRLVINNLSLLNIEILLRKLIRTIQKKAL